MQVDYGNMELARLVLERQADEHLPAVKDHLNTWATLQSSDLGLILQLFKPVNDALVDSGGQVLDGVQEVYAQGAANLGDVINVYADADQRAYGVLQALASSMGTALPGYEDPRQSLPSLGAAKDNAGLYYRSGDPNLFQQAFEDGYRTGAMIQEDVVQGIRERTEEMTALSATVAEEQDVQSYLVEPTGSFSEIENLRWESGVILGALDWVFEKLFGISILNEIVYKPFAGDWNRVQAASGAWKIAGDAIGAVSQNTTGVLPGLAEWTGKGSEQFTLAVAAMAVVDNTIAGVTQTISMVLKWFARFVKEVSKIIGKILKSISYKLARIAAEAAVPVVGWAAAAIEMATVAVEVYEEFMSAYKLVNMIYDFISAVVTARASVIDTYRQVSYVLEALGRGAVSRT